MSSPLRPSTASSRPATGRRRNRPATGSSERPDTAASSIFSLGPAPHTFRPDLDDLSDDGEGFVEESESEAEEGVFAFARPVTGAVPNYRPGGLSPISQGGSFSQPPTTAGQRSVLADGRSVRSPSTAQFSVAPPSVSFSPSGQPTTGWHPPWSADSFEEGVTGGDLPDNRSGSDLSRPDGAISPTQLAPAQQVLANDGERYLRGDPKFGYIESEASSSLSFPTSAGDTAFSQHPVHMHSFGPLVEEGGRRRRSVKYAETEPGSDDGAGLGSWQSHSLAGPTTIPHGQQDQHYDDEFEKGDIIADLEEDDSPYAEVRATVSNLDDYEMPALTFRVWVIGGGLSIILASINCFLFFRNPAPNVPATLGILLAYPLGKAAAALLPISTYTCPSWMPFLGGAEWSLNPCPFNIKEHGLITMMVMICNISAYAIQAHVAAAKYYNVDLSTGCEILLVLSTQLTGIAYAGLTQNFLIWPASLIWPAVLQLCSLLNTLHSGEEFFISRGRLKGMTRLLLFYTVLGGSMVYMFLPGWLFTALSYFSWICWMAPENVVLNQVFGSASGLGLGLLTFDWSQINYIGTPLVTPWWAAANVGVAFVIGYWIIVPALYYSNTFSAKYLPIASSGSFDRFGAPYNLTRIIGSDNALDTFAYRDYSPVYISTALQITYALSMALCAAAITHTGLFYGPRIYRGLRGRKVEEDDVHARVMRRYKTVPHWWYGIVFVVFFSCGIAAVQAYPTEVPVWALLIAYLLPVIYVIPAGYVYALSGITSPMCNVISQIIAGVLFPGQAVPNMIFKAYAVQTLFVAGNYSTALKLGHYLKVPPRQAFSAMLVAASTTALVQVGIKEWLFATTPDICTSRNENSLTCPSTRSFFTASVLWGIIGPERQFGAGAVYNPLLYTFLLGALVPVLLWLYLRRYPMSWLRDVNVPIALSGPLFIPNAPPLNTAVWVLVCFLTQYVGRRRYFRLWSKYNYILSVALDTGTVIGILLIFLCLQLPKNGTLALNWWGNLVWQETLDGTGTTLLKAPETGFGPSTWPA